MRKHLLSLCFLLVSHQLLVSGQTGNISKNNVSDDWQEKAQSYITASEYFFNTSVSDNSYHAANKKQHTGFTFNANGFTVTPIHFADNTDKKDDWKVNLQLKYIGKGSENIFHSSAKAGFYRSTEKKLVVQHNSFSIEYLNDETGIRQNFIIDNKPSGNKNLVVRMAINGNLQAVAESNAVAFKNDKGIIQLHYRDLKVWDANHNILQAEMTINNDGELLIAVNDSKAAYPITIDPINQTPEWATSADGILPTLIGQLAIDAAYGFSVAGLGDVNGDGFDDVAVGAPAMIDLISGTGTLASVGAVFVYYGSANGLPVIPSAKLQPTTAVAGALFGYSIAGGDINNDGKSDIIVGAPLDNVSLSIGGGNTASGKVGKAYVFNGATLNTTTTPFLILQLSGNGILENGVNLSVKALFGFSVAVTEDLNGDGKKDMIVGAPTYAGIKIGLLNSHLIDVQSGGAFVFLTNAANSNVTLTKLNPYKSSLLGLGLLESNISGLLFGYSVDGLGDYNGDGKPDVVATAPAGINASSLGALLNGKLLQGSAIVYYGTGAGVSANPGATLTAVAGGLLSNISGSLANVANLFGVSVKGAKNSAGARNGNVLVGAPLGNTVINVLNLQLKTGTVNVFKKRTSSPSGYVVPDQVLASPRNSNNVLQIIQSNLLFGYSLDNVLDVNCDGIGDIIVGEPASSGVQLLNANVAGGAAYVYLGKADGTYNSAPSWTLTAYEDEFLAVNTTSLIGYSVAGAGKVKGQAGNSRILIGSPSRTLDFGAGLLNLGSTVSTLFSLAVGDNGVGKAFVFDTKQCIALTLTATSPLCNGSNTGAVAATFEGGSSPYLIKIDNGNYASATSPANFSGLGAGQHTVTVKDAIGTERSISITINAPAALVAATSQVNPACPGASNGSFTIAAYGGTGTLAYSGDGGNTYQSSNSFNGLTKGTYNWLIKDANGCTKSGQVILTDPASITATASPTNPSYFGASNGSFVIAASGGTGALTYSKDNGVTYQSSNSFTGLAAGSYNWVVKDANGCTKSGQVTLNCPADITVNVTPTNPLCNGAANGSFVLNVTGGTAPFTYSKDGGATYQSANTFSNLSSGTYNWVVKDASSYSKSGQVTLNNPLAITANSAYANPTCYGAASGSFVLTAGGGTGVLSYSKDGGASYQSSNTFNSLVAGTYNWVVKDANGCAKSGQVILKNPAVIVASATSTNPANGAANGSFTITASGGTGVLAFSKNGGAGFQASNTFSGLSAGVYNWVVKDANGCTKTGQVTLVCTCSGYYSRVAAPSVDNSVLENKFTVYPNPAAADINISFVSAKPGQSVIGLYNINGTFISNIYNGTVKAGVNYQKQITTSKLSSGIYILKLNSKDFSTTQKLVIIK